MKDDYLWDGSGEPDPEIEQLEHLLGRYRHHGEAPELPARLPEPQRSWITPRFAAAAAIILMALAGLLLFLLLPGRHQQPEQATGKTPQEQHEENSKEAPPAPPQKKEEIASNTGTTPEKTGPGQKHSASNKRRVQEAPQKETPVRESPQIVASANPFLDAETAKHLESAQLLLRAFRNIPISETETALDVSYEKQRSRELLDKNNRLRREAESKGNLPVEDLLGDLEPYLLDIANLPDRATTQEVHSIKSLIEKREIVSTLQVYSRPMMAGGF